MDCSIIKSKKYKDLYVVSTTDFFYPLVDDPYLQGRIGCSNVLSDMYALGITYIDNVLMILAASTNMNKNIRNIITKKMMKGFNDCCILADTNVTGGQSVLNPWPIIGGVAKGIYKESDFIRPENGEIGNVLILTKPIGTQISVNLKEWKNENNKQYKYLLNKNVINDNDIETAFNISTASMIRLNRNAAILMHKYKANGATDITGFGIKGHITNLAKNQKKMIKNNIKYQFYVHTLPVIKNMCKVNGFLRDNKILNFKLIQGFSAETSGGLLIMLPKKNAKAFINDIWKMDGWPAYIVGEIKNVNNNESNYELVKFEDEKNMNIIEVGYDTINTDIQSKL